MDLREYNIGKMEENSRKYGRFSIRLYEKLRDMSEQDSLEVDVHFKVSEQEGGDGKWQTNAA